MELLQPSAARFNEHLVRRFVTWLGVRDLSESTQTNYGGAARLFADFLKGTSIPAASHTDALHFLTYLYENGKGRPDPVRLRRGPASIAEVHLPSRAALHGRSGANRRPEDSLSRRRLPHLRAGRATDCRGSLAD